MGRIKELKRNGKGEKRQRRPVTYIICEGKETEVRYFRHFRARDCLIDIRPISSQYKAAHALVQHARDTIRNELFYPDIGDTIWCVFDRDDNTDAMLAQTASYARDAGYQIVFSNPCFELWYLLHFTHQRGRIETPDEVIRMLRSQGLVPNYEKSRDVYTELLEYQGVARNRAKTRIDELLRDDVNIISRDSNPATTVFQLVEYLNAHRVS